MSMRAIGTFEVQTWDEKPYDLLPGGAKLSRASVTQTFDGDLRGIGTAEFLLMYPEDGPATFVGMQRIVGAVLDRDGSFTLRADGTVEGGVARGRWAVVPGSGSDGLRGIYGTGEFTAATGPLASFALEYGFHWPIVGMPVYG